jgi:hypothetical protein
LEVLDFAAVAIRWVEALHSVSGKVKRQRSTYYRVKPAHRWVCLGHPTQAIAVCA